MGRIEGDEKRYCWMSDWYILVFAGSLFGDHPRGNASHTMFMKFQTSSQSFDQILRYEPVRSDIIHAKDDGDVSCYYSAAIIVTWISMILFPV